MSKILDHLKQQDKGTRMSLSQIAQEVRVRPAQVKFACLYMAFQEKPLITFSAEIIRDGHVVTKTPEKIGLL